mgnify:CR=1 FL=1
MIYLGFELANPFINRYSCVYEKEGKTCNPNKFWAFTVVKNSCIIGFSFNWSTRQDHAMIGFDVSLLGWNLDFRVYDSRHWDDKNNRWCEYS